MASGIKGPFPSIHNPLALLFKQPSPSLTSIIYLPTHLSTYPFYLPLPKQHLLFAKESNPATMDFGKLKAMGEKALGGTGATGGQTAPGGSGLDFNQLKSMGEKALGGSSSNTTAPAPTADASNPAPAAPAASGSAEGQDYGDKGKCL